MPIRIAIVGPGRLGTALAALWARAGCTIHGFLGRSPVAAARAVAAVGAGEILSSLADLRCAQVVVLAVGDADVATVAAAAAAAGGVRDGSLWLHTSGRFDLQPLAPVAACGARVGTLHPICPVPDAASGIRDLPGAPAVLLAGPRAERLLAGLARRAGLVPWWSSGGDRARYHAACVLAANGLTALVDAAERGVMRSHVLAGAAPREVVIALMRAALAACDRIGPTAALSGPVVRGDAAAIRCHLAAMMNETAGDQEVYRALMRAAAALAGRGGLDAARREEVERALDPSP